jgi:hypothetical protein
MVNQPKNVFSIKTVPLGLTHTRFCVFSFSCARKEEGISRYYAIKDEFLHTLDWNNRN